MSFGLIMTLSLDYQMKIGESYYTQHLSFFRLEFALKSELYLSEEKISQNANMIVEKLKSPWKYEKENDIPRPSFIRLEKLVQHSKLDTVSAGPNSALCKYIKSFFKDKLGLELNTEDYINFINDYFKHLIAADYLSASPARNKDNEETSVYQFKLDKIVWSIGDKETVGLDVVKQRAYKTLEPKPNSFFQKIYTNAAYI
jgi:hypothetical protein